MTWLEKIGFLAAALNGVSGGTFLLVIASVLAGLVAIAVAWTLRRLRANRGTDRTEDVVREALHEDASRVSDEALDDMTGEWRRAQQRRDNRWRQ